MSSDCLKCRCALHRDLHKHPPSPTCACTASKFPYEIVAGMHCSLEFCSVSQIFLTHKLAGNTSTGPPLQQTSYCINLDSLTRSYRFLDILRPESARYMPQGKFLSAPITAVAFLDLGDAGPAVIAGSGPYLLYPSRDGTQDYGCTSLSASAPVGSYIGACQWKVLENEKIHHIIFRPSRESSHLPNSGVQSTDHDAVICGGKEAAIVRFSTSGQLADGAGTGISVKVLHRLRLSDWILNAKFIETVCLLSCFEPSRHRLTL